MKPSNTLSKVLFTLLALTIILTAGIKAYGEQTIDNVGYEKWSRIAISSVEEKYPEAELVDYKYVKREVVNEHEAKDVFHVKVQDKEKVFIVDIGVVFDPKTGKLITVKIEEIKDGTL